MVPGIRLYHSRNGRVVKLADDLLSASRYAMTMRRFAEPEGGAWSRPIKYPPMGIVCASSPACGRPAARRSAGR